MVLISFFLLISFIFINFLFLLFYLSHSDTFHLSHFIFFQKERRNFMKQLIQIKGLEEQIGVEERKKQKDECGTIRKMA